MIFGSSVRNHYRFNIFFRCLLSSCCFATLCVVFTWQVSTIRAAANSLSTSLGLATAFAPSSNINCTGLAFLPGGNKIVVENRFTGPGFLKMGIPYAVNRLRPFPNDDAWPIPGGRVWRFGVAASVSSDGKFLAASFNRTKNDGCGLCLWNVATLKPQWVKQDAERWSRFGTGTRIAFSSRNRFLAYFNKKGRVIVRHLINGAKYKTLNFPTRIDPGYPTFARISFAFGRRIIAVPQFHIVCWDTATARTVWTEGPPPGFAGFSGNRVALTRKGRVLAATAYPAGRQGVQRKWSPGIALYNVANGKMLRVISIPAIEVKGTPPEAAKFSLLTDITASSDGRYWACTEIGAAPFPHGVMTVGRLVIVGVAQHRVVGISKLCAGGLWSVAISPIGRFVLVSDGNRYLLFRMHRRL